MEELETYSVYYRKQDGGLGLIEFTWTPDDPILARELVEKHLKTKATPPYLGPVMLAVPQQKFNKENVSKK